MENKLNQVVYLAGLVLSCLLLVCGNSLAADCKPCGSQGLVSEKDPNTVIKKPDNYERRVIERPFKYKYKAGSIEKAAFDYAMVVRTQNEKLIKQFYTKEAYDERVRRYGNILDKWLPRADYSKFFQIIIQRHVLRENSLTVEVHYYHSKRYPDFASLGEFQNINGEWKIVSGMRHDKKGSESAEAAESKEY